VGATEFNSLTDATLAGITVDEIAYQAITRLDVTNSGASAYLFTQYTGNNPALYALSGTTIAFKILASGHPFLIQTGAGVNYNDGLVHVSTTGTISTGASAQGKDSGTLYWRIPAGTVGSYKYQCSLHGSMQGTITVKDIAALA
jgi:plastocyanin